MNTLLMVMFSAQLPFLLPPTQRAEVPEQEAKEIVATGPCASPRNSALTWLGNLSQAHDEVRAALCTENIMPMKERQIRMVHLKKIFDARGIVVDIDGLPRTNIHHDEITGRESIVLSSIIPEVYLVKQDGHWLFPRAVLENVPKLYRKTFPFDISAAVKFLPAWMTTPLLGLSVWQVLLLLVLISVGFLVRRVVAAIISTYVKQWMSRFGIQWGSDLVGDWAVPLGALAMAGVWAVALPLLSLPVRLAQVLALGVRAVAAVSIVLLAYRAVDLFAAFLNHRALKSDTKLDDQLVPLARRGLKVVVLAMGVLFVLQNLAVDITSIVATLGVGTIAVALAAKDTVQNLFGSVTIFLDKPFHVGDWVNTCGVEGVVEEVGFRSTRLRTFEDSVVTIPNAKFTDALVNNYGLRNLRRCNTTLELTYDTGTPEIEAFCEGIRKILFARPDVVRERVNVAFKEYGQSGLGVLVYFFMKVPDWGAELRTRHEVFMDIKRLSDALGVEFAFPTQTLHLESQVLAEARQQRKRLAPEELHNIAESFGPGGERVVAPGFRLVSEDKK